MYAERERERERLISICIAYSKQQAALAFGNKTRIRRRHSMWMCARFSLTKTRKPGPSHIVPSTQCPQSSCAHVADRRASPLSGHSHGMKMNVTIFDLYDLISGSCKQSSCSDTRLRQDLHCELAACHCNAVSATRRSISSSLVLQT